MDTKQFILTVLTVSLFCGIGADEAGCRVEIPQDIPKNEPVYLVPDEKGNYSLYIPKDRYITVEQNKNLFMFCSGWQNTFNGNDYNFLSVLCNSNHEFEIDNVTVDFEELYCESKSMGNTRLTKNRCANNQGVLNEIGFLVTDSSFVKIFDVCYNNYTASAIYTKHYINGKAIEYNIKEPGSRPFQVIGIPTNVNPLAAYKQSAIEKHFSQVLGGSQKFFRRKSNLARGHLTPDGDFIFRTAQFATYFIMNVVPKFQVVNNGNWKKVENLVRVLAQKYKRNLLVYTGTYQQLELPDESGKLIPLWLDLEDRIEVPKYLWKVVIDEIDNTGVSFVTLNNPYANKKELSKICHDICEQIQMRPKGFERITSGYTYCCNVNELAEVVGVLPSTVHVRGLLDPINNLKINKNIKNYYSTKIYLICKLQLQNISTY